MGVYADQTAKEYQFSRESQDAYALETLRRAQSATTEGRFKREIAPIELKTGNLDTDELPRKARPDKIILHRRAAALATAEIANHFREPVGDLFLGAAVCSGRRG